MKITLNKKYIEDYQIDRVKDDAKQFSEAFTLGDLLREFGQQVKFFPGVGAEIIKYKIEAMDSGWACGNKTIFDVNMVLDDWKVMYKIHFYIDMELNVDTRILQDGTKLWNIREYREQE